MNFPKTLFATLTKTVIFFLLFVVSLPLIPNIPTKIPAFLRLWWEFIPLLLVILLSFIFIFIIDKGKVNISTKINFPKNLFFGIILGILWLGTVITILLLTKNMTIHSTNDITHLYIWILASFFNVAMQELLVRGYLYQLWRQKYNATRATFITTCIFTLLHGGAFEAGIIPVLNVFSTSLFLTLLLEYTESIVTPIIVHFIWNTFGAIIFGGVSLSSDYPNLGMATLFLTKF